MTPWMQLSLTSFAAAVPLMIVGRHLNDQPVIVSADQAVKRVSGKNGFFLLGLVAIFWLYKSAMSQWVSYDDYSFALGARNEAVWCGANHFLGHWVVHWVYQALKSKTQNSLLMLQYLNTLYTLGLGLVTRQIIIRCTKDRALANLSALLLLVSYGIYKFGTTGKNYPSLLLFWALSLWQGIRIYQENDSWGQFFLLSIFSNLCVLAHDMGSLMAIGFTLSFFWAPPGKRARWTLRYVVTGLLLLPIFLYWSASSSGLTTIKDFAAHHLYYANNPDSGPGDYRFSMLGNSLIVVREGLYSMFTGIDSCWKAYSPLQTTATIVVHSLIAAFLGLLYFTGLRQFLGRSKTSPWIDFPLALVLANWIAIYGFCLFWRPNDEVHHWLLPFTVLAMSFMLVRDRIPAQARIYLLLALLIPAVTMASTGLYSMKSQKLLTSPRVISWLKDLPDTDDYVFSDTQNAILIRYFRPSVIFTSNAPEQVAYVLAGKYVCAHRGDLNHFDPAKFTYTPWPPNPYFYHVQKR